MTLFLDTSAILKRYVEEAGTREVLRAMEDDHDWVAAAVAETETELALCRLVADPDTLELLRGRFRADWSRFLVVAIDPECLSRATEIGCAHDVRALDAIHLAAASRLPAPVVVLTFDAAQASAAIALGLATQSGDVSGTPKAKGQRRIVEAPSGSPKEAADTAR